MIPTAEVVFAVKKNKRFLLLIVVFVLVLLTAFNIPLRLPVPADETISITCGNDKEECHYLLEPGTEEYKRVYDLLEQMRYHLSPRAGIKLTAPYKGEKTYGYAFIGYSGENETPVFFLVSSDGFLDMGTRHYCIGQYGDNKASLWLEALQLALEDVEPDSKEVWSISQKTQ